MCPLSLYLLFEKKYNVCMDFGSSWVWGCGWTSSQRVAIVGWKYETNMQRTRGGGGLTRMMDLEESTKMSTANREEQRTETSGATTWFWRLLENKFKVVLYNGDGSWYMGIEASTYKIACWMIWVAERETRTAWKKGNRVTRTITLMVVKLVTVMLGKFLFSINIS